MQKTGVQSRSVSSIRSSPACPAISCLHSSSLPLTMALFPEAEILSEKAVLGLQALQGAKNENSTWGASKIASSPSGQKNGPHRVRR